MNKQSEIINLAREVKEDSHQLAGLSEAARNDLLLAMAKEIESNTSCILQANQEDLAEANVLLAKGELSQANVQRLALSEQKLDTIIYGIKQVSGLPDPLGKVLLARELDNDLKLYKITCAIGVIAVIFESRPDALPQIISLCLKSGNAAILKGGREARQTNRALFAVIAKALSSINLQSCFKLLEARADVDALLQADRYIDLIIPRGSNELVNYIMNKTRIPVLGHAAGVCHIYVDTQADQDKALSICLDAKTQYPSACNAAEAFLIDRKIAAVLLPRLMQALQAAHVAVRYDKNIQPYCDMSAYKQAQPADNSDWGKEFGDLIVAIKAVSSCQEAIKHINSYGSHHTDAIVTEDKETAALFLREVDSANVYHNASTRFADGFRYGFGAEVGIANGKLHPRGPVGLDGLVTYKYNLIGAGHVVSDYAGVKAKTFTHKDL